MKNGILIYMVITRWDLALYDEHKSLMDDMIFELMRQLFPWYSQLGGRLLQDECN